MGYVIAGVLVLLIVAAGVALFMLRAKRAGHRGRRRRRRGRGQPAGGTRVRAPLQPAALSPDLDAPPGLLGASRGNGGEHLLLLTGAPRDGGALRSLRARTGG